MSVCECVLGVVWRGGGGGGGRGGGGGEGGVKGDMNCLWLKFIPKHCTLQPLRFQIHILPLHPLTGRCGTSGRRASYSLCPEHEDDGFECFWW